MANGAEIHFKNRKEKTARDLVEEKIKQVSQSASDTSRSQDGPAASEQSDIIVRRGEKTKERAKTLLDNLKKNLALLEEFEAAGEDKDKLERLRKGHLEAEVFESNFYGFSY